MKKIILILLLLASGKLMSQPFAFNFNTSGKRVCLAEAEVNLTIPSVTVKLLDATSNTANTTHIYRRPLYGTGADWVLVASNLAAGTTQWTDLNVHAGETWEYKIKRTGTWSYASQTYDAVGYTVGSLLKDNSTYQGQMILLVADNIANGLPAKYRRLKKELTGDGWLVNELIVTKAHGWDSGDTVIGIKNRIKAVYNNAPAGDKPKVLFILGHVPMPRSGSSLVTSPDGHDQNKGARGCDGYYADMDGVYTDVNTFNPGGLETPLAINLPGDFKWDQDFFPSSLEMAFGRVDFADLSDNSLSEIQFTERYLDRLSNYKMVAAGADMGDKTGFFVGYDNSNDGTYRTLPNLSKSAHVMQNTVGAPHPQWIQNNGPFKVYMQNANFPEPGEWDTYGMNATVYSSDQSYWGFNDEPQSFYYSRIRGLLAANTKCLVTLWTTSAVNFFYQACTGEPLGNAVKEIMNHNAVNNNVEKPQQNWDAADWWNRTHMAYNGDPTLRLYQVQPPSNLVFQTGANQSTLSWTVSPDPEVMGYHVYKSTTEFGIYNRVTTALVSGSSYTETNGTENSWYMVRAVKTEESGCGKFLQPSAGIFVMGNIALGMAENPQESKLEVFPNPASHTLTVIAATPMTSIRILTSDGRTALQLNNLDQQETVLDVSTLSPGIYVLEMKSGNKSEVKRVIIN